jgi:hypothetical protein
MKNIIFYLLVVLNISVFGQIRNDIWFKSKNEKIICIYNYSLDKYKLKYFSIDTIEYQFLDYGISEPFLWGQNKDYFYVLQSGGTNLRYCYIFGKKSNFQKVFFQSIAIDSNNNLIAYNPQINWLYIANFNDSIIFKKKFDFIFFELNYYIDTAFFYKNSFYIRWSEQVEDESIGNSKYKYKQFSKFIIQL